MASPKGGHVWLVLASHGLPAGDQPHRPLTNANPRRTIHAPATRGRGNEGMAYTTNSHEWRAIAQRLSEEWQVGRELWFSQVVHYLKDLPSTTERPIVLENEELGGSAELGMKAFQLFHATQFLAQASGWEGDGLGSFTRLLAALVCGDHLDECLALLPQYEATFAQDATSHNIAFSRDVAREIAGTEPSIDMCIAISFCVCYLYGATLGAVAEAFGDEERAKGIREQLEEWNRHI